MKSTKIIITCEHYSNHVPEEFAHLFQGNEGILEKHYGYDIGFDDISEGICQIAELPLFKASISRLLIDFNRNLHHPQLFSKFTKKLNTHEKRKLIARYYAPYGETVESEIKKMINDNLQVLHLSIHTFTPKLHNILRKSDIGILYDPKCHAEKEVARVLKNFIISENNKYTIRLNYPYKGKSDGFTTSLRKKYLQTEYLGIEIECNQKLVTSEASLTMLTKTLSNSIRELKRYL